MQKAGGGIASKGVISNARVAKLLPHGWSHVSLLWRSFWRLADEVDQHYVWRGPTKDGLPVFTGYGLAETFPASHLAYVYSDDKHQLRPDERLEPTCKRKLCIRPEHQAVLRSAR